MARYHACLLADRTAAQYVCPSVCLSVTKCIVAK